MSKCIQCSRGKELQVVLGGEEVREVGRTESGKPLWWHRGQLDPTLQMGESSTLCLRTTQYAYYTCISVGSQEDLIL